LLLYEKLNDDFCQNLHYKDTAFFFILNTVKIRVMEGVFLVWQIVCELLLKFAPFITISYTPSHHLSQKGGY